MAETKKDDAVDVYADMTAEELTDYLSTNDDFALELRVLQSAKQYRLAAVHGSSYTDPVTQKSRQFDLHVIYDFRWNDGTVRSLRMSIECKNLQRHYPLLVSRMMRDESESYHFGIERIQSLALALPLRKQRSLAYPKKDWVGKSMTQVGRAKEKNLKWKASDSDTFDKWTQAINSSAELIASTARMTGVFKAVVIPILVVSNDTLWVVDYDNDGRVTNPPKLVDEATFFVGRTLTLQIGQGTVSHLHIFTENGVKAFMSKLEAGEYADLFFVD